MNKEPMSVIDMLSVICFYLTIETMNDNKMLEEHLRKQDQKIDMIVEVLKHDGR